MEGFFKENVIWEIFYCKIFMQIWYFVVWFFYCFIYCVREREILIGNDNSIEWSIIQEVIG